MQQSKILIVLFLFIGLAISGFQCSSTELTSAKLYLQQKNYDKALESLLKEVEKNPSSDEGYYYLGVVYGEKENYDKMLEAYDKSLEISKKYAQNISDSKKYYWANLFNRGVAFYQRGINADNQDSNKVYFDKSINSFHYAIKIQPDSSDTYKNLAFVYMSDENYDEAIGPLKEIIKREHELDGYRFLGEIYYNKGMIAQAEDSIKAVGYFNQAIEVLEEGRKYHPGDSELLLVLSNSYIGANKIDIAIDAFKEGVIQEPENKYYRYNYGVLLLGSEEYEKAEEQFLKAIEIDPEYQNAIYNIAVTYVRWGTHINKEAEERGEMSSEYKEKYKAALPYLQKVIEAKEDDAAMWELLGRVYTVLDMQKEATEAFNKADQLR
jgi:tetratricopeptide (TPR) repeat protein